MKKIFFILAILTPSFLFAAESGKTSEFFKDGTETVEISQGDTLGLNKEKHGLRLGIGASVSTNGFGLNLVADLNKYFTVRAGYEYMALKIGDASLTSGSYSYSIDPKYKTGGFSFAVEGKVYKSFYIVAGIVQTTMGMDLNLKLDDNIKFGDIEYTPDEVGELNINLTPKNKFAPYLGLGWSPKIFHNERLRLNFELGAYYINSFKAKASGTNLLALNGDDTVAGFNDEVESMDWTKFYPIARIGFTYIFY